MTDAVFSVAAEYFIKKKRLVARSFLYFFDFNFVGIKFI